MKISCNTFLVVCSYLHTYEIISKVFRLCKRLNHDVPDNVIVKQGRVWKKFCPSYLWELLRTHGTLLDEQKKKALQAVIQ